MSVQKLAKLFGVIVLLVGILGFVPGVTSNGHLLGIFEVNTLHNIIHLASGILALAASMSSAKASRMFFQVFGVVYGLVTVVGFVQGNTVLGLIGVNLADNLLHLAISAFALYAGFMMKPKSMPMANLPM